MLWILLQYRKEPRNHFPRSLERPVYRVIFQQVPKGLERGSPMKYSVTCVPGKGAGQHAQNAAINDKMKLKEVYNLRYQRWRRKTMRNVIKGNDIRCR